MDSQETKDSEVYIHPQILVIPSPIAGSSEAKPEGLNQDI